MNPKTEIDDRTEEADKVALRIAKILSEKAFSFTPNEYISIHKKLFIDIYKHAGKIRDYNERKRARGSLRTLGERRMPIMNEVHDIILPRKSGCLMELPYCMEVHRSCGQLLIMISQKKRSSVIKD